MEKAPRITYSPDGILELHKTIEQDSIIESPVFQRKIENIANNSKYELSLEDKELTIKLDPSEFLVNKEQHFQNPEADKLIDDLTSFTYFDYQDKREGVFSLGFWSKLGAEGKIHTQFQRWVNSKGFSEEVARDCIKAMALPFNKEVQKQAKKEFEFYTVDNNQIAISGIFRIVSRNEEFNFMKIDHADSIGYKRGKVLWNWIDISTLGGCACWGPSGEERMDVQISDEINHLYSMLPHNVDTATQSVSLVLGMARLAYEASIYDGEEDILEHAEFFPSRW